MLSKILGLFSTHDEDINVFDEFGEKEEFFEQIANEGEEYLDPWLDGFY
ncbi:hypothetical protein [Virgibacillus litoralis]|uniref:Uncharacterized protein n=1 Tax=Virgibacillus litoralis TaxID=578221 RepID=A0ABS4HHA5_9BACI|nr:hypothetical protein [Virgibacillus litoralis]MBP1950306.1 hypothetical protein [Virgibacillus litoralis]